MSVQSIINRLNATFNNNVKNLLNYCNSNINSIMNSKLSNVTKNNNIKHIVRLCDPTYDLNDLNDLNYDVKIYDWKFTDGDNPPSDIIDKWKELLKLNVGPILIHCMAGLGRAPSIAAIGLIELKIKPFDAIKLIRDKRPGSINSKQLSFIMNYKPTNKKSCIFSKIFSCQYY